MYIKWLLQLSSWNKVVVCLGLNFAIQAVILFVMYPAISAEKDPLDVQGLLTPTLVDTFFSSIGSHGRALYFINEATLDVLFPIIYAFAYALLLIELFKLNELTQSRLMHLALLPFMIATVDVVENIHILISLDLYPLQNDAVIHVLSIANAVKHSLSAILLVVVLALLVRVFGLKYLNFNKRKGNRDDEDLSV